MTRRKNRVLSVLMILAVFSAMNPVAGKTVVDETINIGALDIDGYGFNVNSDDMLISVSLEVLSGNDVSFFVADRANTESALGGQNYEYYGGKDNIVKGSYDITLGPSGEYWVVLDNLDSIFAIKVAVEISFTTGSFLGLAVIVLVIGAIIYFVRRRRKKAKEQMMYQQQQMMYQQQQQQQQMMYQQQQQQQQPPKM